jgi:hypothetical protein
VGGQEQRDLCFAGLYQTCPRFRNASTSKLEAQSTSATRLSEPSPGVPAGVGNRMVAAGQTPLAGLTLDDNVGPNPDQPARHSRDVKVARPGRRTSRIPLLFAGGALLGAIVLALATIVAIPAFNTRYAHELSAAASQAAEPLPTPTPAATPVAEALAAVTPAPALTVPSRPATATARSLPSLSTGGGPLIDVQFGGGPGERWIDNPPYAAWSGGAYRLEAHQASRFVAVGAPFDRLLRNVVVSATFRKTGGPPGGGYGLLIRDQGPEPSDGVKQMLNAYVLEAGDIGEFGIWRRDGDLWVDLVPWTRSAAIRPGGSPNELTARAAGARLTFSINGVEAAWVEDDTLPAGGVGVFVGGDFNEVALDHFTVEVPN